MVKNMNKEEVIKITKELTKNYSKVFCEIFLSKEPIEISTVKDAMGKKIFDDNGKIGWLLFINPSIFANWAHECTYYFIISKEFIIVNKECNMPPDEIIDMEELKQE